MEDSLAKGCIVISEFRVFIHRDSRSLVLSVCFQMTGWTWNLEKVPLLYWTEAFEFCKKGRSSECCLELPESLLVRMTWQAFHYSELDLDNALTATAQSCVPVVRERSFVPGSIDNSS